MNEFSQSVYTGRSDLVVGGDLRYTRELPQVRRLLALPLLSNIVDAMNERPFRFYGFALTDNLIYWRGERVP